MISTRSTLGVMDQFVWLPTRIGQIVIMSWVLTTSAGGQESPAALSGFESSEIFDVQDEKPWNHYQEVVSRLLYRVLQVSESSLRQYAKRTEGVQPADICKAPRDYRFHVFELRGRVKELADFPSDGSDPDLPFDGYSLSRLIADDRSEFVVVTPVYRDAARPSAVPARWPRRSAIDQPVVVRGFFLALVDSTEPVGGPVAGAAPALEEDLVPVFVAPGLVWLADQSSGQIPVGDAQLLLARYGVDIGRMEALQNSRSAAIGKHETDIFFQLLSAAARIQQSEQPVDSIDFMECLQHPHQHHGDLVSVSGYVRRATRLSVTDDALKQRYGLDHYFQLDLFVSLENQRIVIRPPGAAAEEGETIVHENRYPVTICVPSLPCSESEIERRQITVTGFFFKIWNYESELTQQQAIPLKHRSPLIIGIMPELISPPPDYVSYAIGAGCLMFVAGLTLLVWILYLQKEARGSVLKNELPETIEIMEPPGD